MVVASAIGATTLDPQQTLHVDPLARVYRQTIDRLEVMLEAYGKLQIVTPPLQRVQYNIGGQPSRWRLRVDRLGAAADMNRLTQQHAVASEDFVWAHGLDQRTVFVLWFESNLGACRTYRHRRYAVSFGVAGDVTEA